MIVDRHHITTASDMHGEPCPVCDTAPSVTNVYLVNADGDDDTRHTCGNDDCITHTLATHHHSDTTTPVVEHSTACVDCGGTACGTLCWQVDTDCVWSDDETPGEVAA